MGTGLLSPAAFGAEVWDLTSPDSWEIPGVFWHGFISEIQRGTPPLQGWDFLGRQQCPSATGHPAAGTRGIAGAGEWFPKPLPPASSCGWTWGERSELVVRNLWTEAAERSLVKCSAGWYFSSGLKNATANLL